MGDRCSISEIEPTGYAPRDSWDVARWAREREYPTRDGEIGRRITIGADNLVCCDACDGVFAAGQAAIHWPKAGRIKCLWCAIGEEG